MEPIEHTIRAFLSNARQPWLYQPGEEPLALTEENLVLEEWAGNLTLVAWDERRNLSRRVLDVEEQTRGKLVLKVERFGRKTGTMTLVDREVAMEVAPHTRAGREQFREVFRRFLQRQFPRYTLAELSTAADLHESLSPNYPRALLRQGTSAWAAIGCPANFLQAEGVVSFGLIWLDYLRRRDQGITIHGLVLYLPEGLERTTCLRLAYLDSRAVRYWVFVYEEGGCEFEVDPRDYGNLDTRLEAAQTARPADFPGLPDVDCLALANGEQSLRVRGLEFARTDRGRVLAGLTRKRAVAPGDPALARLVNRLADVRCAESRDRQHRHYLVQPESWLESQVRRELEELDATLCAAPVYGQVPAFAAAERGVIDLLAVDRGGRLAVIELKASEDIHLPLQALDYWLRVKWHLDRKEFAAAGYFPGVILKSEPPRLLLVAPSLAFHPTNERVLRFFSPEIEVECLGVGVEWRRKVKVVFRRATPPCP